MNLDFYPKSLFKLSDAYTFGVQFGEKVIKNINGRACGMPHDYGLLAQTVFNAGDGDYVETGTFYGASAIIAAKTKLTFNLKGMIICIDPLEGFYGEGRKDGKTNDYPTPDKVMKNAFKFKVANKFRLITKPSYPFPDELKDKKFACAYIDGDHWGDLPTKDWLNLKDRTSKYIIIDNYDATHPSVKDAAELAITDKDWTLVHQSSISLILEKNPVMKNTFRSGMKYEERH